MKIRDKIVLSNLGVILLVSVTASILVGEVIINRLTERNTKTAINSVAGIAEFNYKLSKRILTDYGAAIVELRADNAALRLSSLLRGEKIEDYEAIRSDEAIRDVATADINFDGQRVGHLDVFDREGVCVLHPNRSLEGTNYNSWMDQYPKMWELVQRSFSENQVSGQYKFIDENDQARDKHMVIVHVPDTPFNVTAVVNLDDFYASVHRQIQRKEGNLTANVESVIAAVADKTRIAARKFGLIIIAGATLISLVFGLWFANTIARPISNLTEAVQDVGRGDFSTQVEVGDDGDDEVARLGRAFNHLGTELKEYMENLRREVAARQSVESELKIARDIQRSLLPNVFPPFPQHDEFSLRALLEPAREVAGDFYDYFFTDDDILTVVVGDVSGKGIPAAFFMAVTRTLIKSVSFQEDEPDKVLEIANRILSSENDACMFVTLFLGFYDVRTGTLTYANGGHPPAIRLPAVGAPEPLKPRGNAALGITPERDYDRDVVTLNPGDTLVLYTDGVTEAQTADGKMWGDDDFQAALAALPDRSPETICGHIAAEAKAFENDVLFDDLTILALRRER